MHRVQPNYIISVTLPVIISVTLPVMLFDGPALVVLLHAGGGFDGQLTDHSVIGVAPVVPCNKTGISKATLQIQKSDDGIMIWPGGGLFCVWSWHACTDTVIVPCLPAQRSAHLDCSARRTTNDTYGFAAAWRLSHQDTFPAL